MKQKRNKIIIDAVVIAASIAAAFYLSKSPFIEAYVTAEGNFYMLTSLIAGFFYTSVFTTALSIALFAELGNHYPPLVIAFLGGIGATIVDVAIFRFLKERVANDISFFVSRSSPALKNVLGYWPIRFSVFLLGAIAIVTPLPNGIGFSLMGIKHVSPKVFSWISFVFNFAGILAIALISRSI